MDNLQLRDEAVRDRVRAAQEFLDPRKHNGATRLQSANRPQLIPPLAATDQTSY
jgi:hypothetical protein